MKNKKFEMLGRSQKQYHRNHQWRLNEQGLYVPHSYDEREKGSLTWWDDVGFIINGRRIIVWFRHPRYVYSGAIDDVSWKMVGDGPDDDWLTEGGTTNYRKVGRSRKKVSSYTCRSPSTEQSEHYARLSETRKRLHTEGIDFDVRCEFRRERLSWATGVSLTVPVEVSSEADLVVLAGLARNLVLGKTTLDKEFPDYVYGRSDWLAEQKPL